MNNGTIIKDNYLDLTDQHTTPIPSVLENPDLTVFRKGEGRKFDAGKLRMDLIEPEWLEELARVLTLGATNHGDRQWMQVAGHRYEGALLRHYCKAVKGVQWNDEVDIHGKVHRVNHWAQIAINALFRMSQEMKA